MLRKEVLKDWLSPRLSSSSILQMYIMLEKNGGEIFTDVQWKFHHFGPCSYPLSETIQKKIPNIQVESDETKDEGHIFILIKLSDHGCRKTLQDTGLGIAITSSLESNLKKSSCMPCPVLAGTCLKQEIKLC